MCLILFFVFLARLFYFRCNSCFDCVSGTAFLNLARLIFIWCDCFYLARLLIFREQASDKPARTPVVVLVVASHDTLNVRAYPLEIYLFYIILSEVHIY